MHLSCFRRLGQVGYYVMGSEDLVVTPCFYAFKTGTGTGDVHRFFSVGELFFYIVMFLFSDVERSCLAGSLHSVRTKRQS